MDTADVLRRKRAKLVGQIEFIDELLAEMGQVDDAPPVAETRPPVAPCPVGEIAPGGRREAPAPKADCPPAQKRARTPGPDAAGYADRVAAVLLGGPLKVADICEKTGVSYPTVDKVLKADPARFLRTGVSMNTRWELTQEGRQAAQSQREG